MTGGGCGTAIAVLAAPVLASACRLPPTVLALPDGTD